MVSLELLSSLDGLLWLQSGKEVGAQLHQHQTTISRNLRKCAEEFGLSLKKHNGTWAIDGDTQLLNLEREVHQSARFLDMAPLRLEANGWMDGGLFHPAPDGWLTGTNKPLGVYRCLHLLRACIVDAWICPLPDAPLKSDLLSSITLCRVPIRLMVSSDHPLLKLRSITLKQTKTYPWRPIPRGAYPGTERTLQKLGIWPPARPRQKVEEQSYKGRKKTEISVHVGSVLTKNLSTQELVALPLELDANTGVALVVKRENIGQEAIRSLRETLLHRLKRHQFDHPEIHILD